MDDFQIRAAENGYVLINLKTKRAQLIYDEFSKLSDLKQLFPNVHFVESGQETADAEDKSESATADGPLSKASQTDRDNQTRTSDTLNDLLMVEPGAKARTDG